MDTKRVALIGGMVVLAGVMFMQVKKMGQPAPAPVVKMQAPAPVVQQVEMSHILVANQTLYLGTRITPEMLEWRKWPRDAVSAVFIDQDVSPTAIEDYTGAVARMEISEGEPLTARKLVKTGDKSVMAAIIKPGFRAVTIRISSDSAAAGFINPGDRVDIIMTRRMTGPNQNNGFIAETVFENVPVMSIDQTYRKGPEGGAVVLGNMATFELSQEDAEKLIVAQSSGDLSLTLRPMSNARSGRVISRANIETSKEERVSTLSVYRGGEVEQVMLKGQ